MGNGIERPVIKRNSMEGPVKLGMERDVEINIYENIKILYEDNHLLVVEKPVNMLTQADITGDDDLLSRLKQYLKQKYNKPGNVYLGLVHRLDRPVGGVMVFARTSKAASRLSDQIRNGELEKSYLAVVHGKIPEPSGRLTDYLVKDNATNTVSVTQNADEGKKAVLDFNVIDSKEGLTLVKINLVTGRPHQIRVQFSNMGHPLYGDQKYGQNLNRPGMQLALWSCQLNFTHPTLKVRLSFNSYPKRVYPWDLFDYPGQLC